MNQPSYTKYTGLQGLKEPDTSIRRQRPARESEPPMMSNNSMFEKPSQLDTYRAKQPPSNDQLARLHAKYMGQQSDAEKLGQPTYKSTIGVRSTDPNTLKKDDNLLTQMNKTQTNSRFMSPELKSFPLPSQKVHERKYSNQIGESTYTSKSNTQIPSSSTEYGLHRSNTEAMHLHGNSSGSRQQCHVNNPTIPPKRQPRFSEPANFSMDMMEDSDAPAVIPSPVCDDSKLSTKVKEPQKQQLHSPLPSLGIKNTYITPTAFRKEKELKETVSTQSTFQSMEEAPRTFMKMDPKYSSNIKKTTPDPIKLSDFIKGREIGSGKFGSVFIVK